jgi:hypothetical protein
MFTDEETKDYAEQLQQLGITEETEQIEVLEYFYQLGTIIYLKKTNDYGEEEN